jgi:long-chain acyl-CoA synthetase
MQEKLQTIGRLFLNRVELSDSSNSIGWIEDDNLNFYTYKDYKAIIESLALGLIENGLAPGDKIAILANTCKEWHCIDLSSLCSKAVVVPIYNSYLPTEISYIINHSETSILCVENTEQFKKILEIQDQLPKIKFLVSFAEIESELKNQLKDIVTITYKELLLQGGELIKINPKTFVENIKTQSPHQIASIFYTSGTTGEPKGAVITQEAFSQMLQNVKAFTKGAFTAVDRSLVVLPLSHVIGRCDSFLHLAFGSELVFAESMPRLLDNIKIVKPTYMLAVPRVFEKIYSKIMAQVQSQGIVQRQLFKWAINVANKYYSKIDRDLSPSALEIAQYRIAYNTVFKKVFQAFGGKVRFFISGGAPLSTTIIKFLRNANLPILEGYGLTETCGPAIANPVSRQIPGTVGKPIGDVEIRFAKDNEILIKSRAMLTQYYKNSESTNECLVDGWLYTGDIGHFDEHDYLVITDRKKDIIITSGGKNVAPQKIENLMKLQDHISHVAVFGDRKNYLTAIVGIERASFEGQSTELGVDLASPIDQLAHNPKIRSVIRAEVELINDQLASFETIKKFYILPVEISTSNYLTPSLKVKKKMLFCDYKDEIAAMYN